MPIVHGGSHVRAIVLQPGSSEHPPHHVPFGFEDVSGREAGQFTERTQARVNRRLQEVPERLAGDRVDLLFILRTERQESRLLRRLLQRDMRVPFLDGVECVVIHWS